MTAPRNSALPLFFQCLNPVRAPSECRSIFEFGSKFVPHPTHPVDDLGTCMISPGSMFFTAVYAQDTLDSQRLLARCNTSSPVRTRYAPAA